MRTTLDATFEHKGAIVSSTKPNSKVMQLGPVQIADLTLQIIAKQTFINSNKKVVTAFFKSGDFTRKVAFVQ